MAGRLNYVTIEIPVEDHEMAQVLGEYIYDQIAGTRDARREDIAVSFDAPSKKLIVMIFNTFHENHRINLDIFERLRYHD